MSSSTRNELEMVQGVEDTVAPCNMGPLVLLDAQRKHQGCQAQLYQVDESVTHRDARLTLTARSPAIILYLRGSARHNIHAMLDESVVLTYTYVEPRCAQDNPKTNAQIVYL